MIPHMRSQLVLWTSLVLLSGCGSGNGLAPVKGRVTLDGKPVEGAAVLFQAESGGVPATGVTGASGEFELSTSGVGVGATIGKNGVSVAKTVSAQPNRKVEDSEIVPMKSETPVRYASPTTSGINVDVKPGMELVELTLTSGK